MQEKSSWTTQGSMTQKIVHLPKCSLIIYRSFTLLIPLYPIHTITQPPHVKRQCAVTWYFISVCRPVWWLMCVTCRFFATGLKFLWKIYRGPGILAVIWFGLCVFREEGVATSPPPSPPPLAYFPSGSSSNSVKTTLYLVSQFLHGWNAQTICTVLLAEVACANFYSSPLNANPLMFWASLLNVNPLIFQMGRSAKR